MRNRIVTLTDVIDVAPTSSSNAAANYVFSVNGYNKVGDTADGPQQELWNRYAQMFSLYTVRDIEFRYIPYRPYTVALNNDVKSAIFEPTYSVVVDSDNAPPVNNDEYLAHSYMDPKVCRVVRGDKEHSRKFGNCQKLLL